MRKASIFAALCLLGILRSGGAAGGEVALPDILPADAIACMVPADDHALEFAYANSIFRRMGDMPEMAAFFNSLDESRRALTQDLAVNSGVPGELAWEITNARLGAALLNVGIDREGNPVPEFLVVLQLRVAPDRQQIFSAVRTLLNRREVVRAALESQGLDPNMPLKTLAQEETIPGYPPMLRIGPRIRVAVVGRMVLLYNGPGADGIRSIFDAAQNPARSLAGSALYQATLRGAEAEPGMAFTFVNLPRLVSLLDAAGMSPVTRVLDTLGVASAQAVGLAGGYRKEGMRHNLYFHMSNRGNGVLSTLLPMPSGASAGVEVYSQIVPAQAEAFSAMRMNLGAFLEEAPYFAEAVGGITRPGGMSGYLSNETLLGVPLREFATVLGEDVVIRPHEDTQAVFFGNVDVNGFERLIARMEQFSGSRFRTLDVGGYTVRYFNQRAEAAMPLAPSFCLIPTPQAAGKGVLYVASHPQALVSLIREATTSAVPISRDEDFIKATSGLDRSYSLFFYADCRSSYRRFYNTMLPLAALWASTSSYPVDTGLLPTAATVMPGLFGCAFGIKVQPQGLTLQAYSPVGINALFILVADKLVLSNPIILGYVHAWAVELREAIPW